LSLETSLPSRVVGDGRDRTRRVLAVDEFGNVACVLHSFNGALWGSTGIFVDGISIPDSAFFQQRLIADVGPGARLPDPSTSATLCWTAFAPVVRRLRSSAGRIRLAIGLAFESISKHTLSGAINSKLNGHLFSINVSTTAIMRFDRHADCTLPFPIDHPAFCFVVVSADEQSLALVHLSTRLLHTESLDVCHVFPFPSPTAVAWQNTIAGKAATMVQPS
jgi:hypothetical protein